MSTSEGSSRAKLFPRVCASIVRFVRVELPPIVMPLSRDDVGDVRAAVLDHIAPVDDAVVAVRVAQSPVEYQRTWIRLFAAS
jgi:hypothetical protein